MPLRLDGVDVLYDVGVIELLEEVDLTLIFKFIQEKKTQVCGRKQPRESTNRLR